MLKKDKIILSICGAGLIAGLGLMYWAHGELKYLKGRADQRQEFEEMVRNLDVQEIIKRKKEEA